MSFPATTPTLSVAATALAGNNATTAGLPNSNGFDRLTYLEAIVGNLLTDLPTGITYPIGGNVRGLSILSSNSGGTTPGGIGYLTGAGSTTTQITSKVTAFTCNTITGQITFSNAALAGSSTTATALWNCSAMSANDIVVFNHVSGGTIGPYTFQCSAQSTSSALICITNNSTQSLSEAVVVRYAIIKAVQS